MERKVAVLAIRTHRIAAVTLLLLVTCACVDLDQVTQFAKASQDVGKSFPTVADKAEVSCHRANSFINDQNPHTALSCGVYADLNPQLVKINGALFTYIGDLGKLASSDLSKVPGGFDKLSADLKAADPNISKENQSKASAAGDLAKAITNIWASGYRQHELTRIIRVNNKAVQNVTEFLSEYAVGKYEQSFHNEWESERSYCDAMKSPSEPLASDLLKRKCDADEAHIKAQMKALADYRQALATIARTHQKLADSSSHWDSAQLLKGIGPETVSLGSAAISINNAF